MIFELVHLAHPFCTRKSPRFPEGKWTSFPEGSGDPVVISGSTDRSVGRMGVPNFSLLSPVSLFHRTSTAIGLQLQPPGTLSGEGGLGYKTVGLHNSTARSMTVCVWLECPPSPLRGRRGLIEGWWVGLEEKISFLGQVSDRQTLCLAE